MSVSFQKSLDIHFHQPWIHFCVLEQTLNIIDDYIIVDSNLVHFSFNPRINEIHLNFFGIDLAIYARFELEGFHVLSRFIFKSAILC